MTPSIEKFLFFVAVSVVAQLAVKAISDQQASA